MNTERAVKPACCKSVCTRADVIICFRAHRFIHHHLQHQVDAALEVKTEVDAVGQRRLPGRQANALRNAEDAKDEDEKNCNDQEMVLRMGVAIRFFAGLTVCPRNTVISLPLGLSSRKRSHS